MGWLKRTFSSTIGTKVLVGLTGLGLIGFLVLHMVGNLFIYSDGGKAINQYADDLHNIPGFAVLEVSLIALFLGHIALTVKLIVSNRRAKGGRYAVSATKRKEDVLPPVPEREKLRQPSAAK